MRAQIPETHLITADVLVAPLCRGALRAWRPESRRQSTVATTLKRSAAAALLIAAGTLLISCASEKQPASVVKDSDTQKESAIPWNQQQKWEVGSDMSQLGQMGGTSDRAR